MRERQTGSVSEEIRAPSESGIESLVEPIIQREDIVRDGLLFENRLQFFQLLLGGLYACRVAGEVPIIADGGTNSEPSSTSLSDEQGSKL